MRILFLNMYDSQTASTRVRIHQYLPYLETHNIHYNIIVANVGNNIKYVTYILNQLRLLILPFILIFINNRYDALVVQKVVIPRVTSWLLPLFYSKIIYEFDDALFIYPFTKMNLLNKFIHNINTFNFIYMLKISNKVITTNNYNKKFALAYCDKVTSIPGPIDTKRYNYIVKTNSEKIILGWIGSPSTSQYLKGVENVLKSLKEIYPLLEIVLIGVDETIKLNFEYTNNKWSYITEVNELKKFDIGIMPLPDNDWTRGKGAYKLLQYMSMGIPSVSSPVGVVNEIIQDGINGFIANNDDEWIHKIKLLVENENLRNTIRKNARFTVENNYAIEKASELFINTIVQ